MLHLHDKLQYNYYEGIMAETPPSAIGPALPGQPPGPPQNPAAPSSPPVVVKKYANRRLYNTETSSYITLENLADMIRAGRDFVVYDAKSGDDITRGVLTQIIVEEESKGSAMLPTGFLRQLIGFYGGNLQGVVPRYLEHSMASFARQQQQVRQMMERTLSPFLPTGMEEMNRQNMALFERAVSMWNPFLKPTELDASSSASSEPATASVPDQSQAELDRLRHEVESLRRQLAAAHAAAVVPMSPLNAATGNVSGNVPENVPGIVLGHVPENVLAHAPANVPENGSANAIRDQPEAPKSVRKPARNRTSVES